MPRRFTREYLYDKKAKRHMLKYLKLQNKINNTDDRYYKTIERWQDEAMEHISSACDYKTKSRVDRAIRDIKNNKAYFLMEQTE